MRTKVVLFIIYVCCAGLSVAQNSDSSFEVQEKTMDQKIIQADSSKNKRPGIEVSAGATIIIYQNGFSMNNAFGLELTGNRKFAESFEAQLGGRFWFGANAQDIFGRIRMRFAQSSWRPSAGLEIGISNLTSFDEGKMLLRETRLAMNEKISPFYFSSHISPLSFNLKNKWRLSVAEINIGTHFSKIGRTLRVYVTAFSISKQFN